MRKLLILTCLFLLFAVNAKATTYWASPSGGAASCAAASGSSDPGVYRTYTQGKACMSAADKLMLTDGTYVYVGSAQNDVPSGTNEATRTWVQAVNAGLAILMPSSGQSAVFFNANQNYITFDGIVCDGTNLASTCVKADPVNYFTWSNGEIRNTGRGAGGYNRCDAPCNDNGLTGGGTHMLITNTLIYNNGSGAYDHGLYITGDFMVITHSQIYHNAGHGIHRFDTGDHFTISNNKIYQNGQYDAAGTDGHGIGIYGGANNAVYYNEIYENHGHGITQNYGEGHDVVFNNTVYANLNVGINNATGASDIKNNLVLSNAGGNISCGGSSTCSGNITSGSIGSYVVNAAGGDFTLISTSPAINAGASSIGTINIGGATVQVVASGNPTPDIGAHQKLGAVTCTIADATPTKIDCSVVNNVNPPLLPATGITGWTVTGKTVSSNVRVGTNGFQLTVTVAYTAGTCALTYAQTGNLTDSALIGSSNQELFAGAASCTNNVGGATTTVITQSHAAMFEWNGNEGSGAQIGATNQLQAYRPMVFGKFLGRFGLKVTVADSTATNYALRYSLDGAGYAVMPTFTGAEPVGICDAPAVSNGNTIQRITSGSFLAGRVVEVGAGVPTLTLLTGQSSELLYPICFGPGLVAGTSNLKFRVYKDDGSVLAYDDPTATLNVDVVSPGLAGL